MLSDRERRELAGIERHLMAMGSDGVDPPAPPPVPQPEPWPRRPVRTTVAAAVLLLLALLLLGVGPTVVLVLGIAAVFWGVAHRRGSAGRGPDDPA